MTAKRLRQYKALCREIADLGKKIENSRPGSEVVSDVVSGSDNQYPYVARRFTVTGAGADQRGRLRRMQEVCRRERDEILAYIDAIEDSITRQIFRYRHIEGLSWRAVAFRMGGVITESGVRMIHDRYLRKN